MNKKQRDDLVKFSAWKRRVNKDFRKDDTGGRPLPQSAIEQGKHKPYQAIERVKPIPEEVTAREETPEPEEVTAREETPEPEEVTAREETPEPEEVTAREETP